jgi:hypothetical protein
VNPNQNQTQLLFGYITGDETSDLDATERALAALAQVEALVEAAKAVLATERQRPVANLDANQAVYRALAPWREPFKSGRFTLFAHEDTYVTSWDTWEEAAVAWPEAGRLEAPYRLVDNETGRVWHPGSRHEWEDAQT